MADVRTSQRLLLIFALIPMIWPFFFLTPLATEKNAQTDVHKHPIARRGQNGHVPPRASHKILVVGFLRALLWY